MKNLKVLALIALLSLSAQAQEAKHSNPHMDQKKAEMTRPFYQGTVVEAIDTVGYSYLKIKEKTQKTFWIAVIKQSDVKKGDHVRFQKEMVIQKFKSKSLNKTFDEIMFASNLQRKIKS